jgi:hypothetical protein
MSDGSIAYVAVFRYKDISPDRPEARLLWDTGSGLVKFQIGFDLTPESGWVGSCGIKKFTEWNMALPADLAFGRSIDVQFRFSPEDSFRLARRGFSYIGIDPDCDQHSWTSDSATIFYGPNLVAGNTYPWVARIWFLRWQLMEVKLSDGALQLQYFLLSETWNAADESGPEECDQVRPN